MQRYLLKMIIRLFDWAYRKSELQRYNQLRKRYDLDKSFRFNGKDILMYGEGRIRIGPGSYVGGFSTLQSSKGYEIVIGSHCRISHNVRFYTSSNVADQNFVSPEVKKFFGSISVDDGVWIGANAFISPGVTLGRNSIIGANSVVTKDVEENAIVGGVPARLIRYKSIHA